MLCAEGTDDLSANELCTGVAELKGNVRRPSGCKVGQNTGYEWSFGNHISRVTTPFTHSIYIYIFTQHTRPFIVVIFITLLIRIGSWPTVM